jgi:heme oxygenase
LRDATAERHAILDSGLAIGGPHATLADYRQHLCLLRAWLGPIESWLAQFDDGPQGTAAPTPLLRTPVIEADLAQMPGECGPVDALPWPAEASAAYRWGVCYVVEGSQLGGAVLYQRLAPVLDHPLHYLRGQEQGPGPRWRSFMLALKAEVETPEEIAQACAGACDGFDRILALRT